MNFIQTPSSFLVARSLRARSCVASPRTITAVRSWVGRPRAATGTIATRSAVTIPALNDRTREIAGKLLCDGTDPLHRRFALSRAITLLESTNEERAMEAEGLLAHLLTERAAASANSLRIGIAGPPVSTCVGWLVDLICVSFRSHDAYRRAPGIQIPPFLTLLASYICMHVCTSLFLCVRGPENLP